mmetsp:Transcript_7573/g.8339  ORF Transcript_7573/g.8339 Transcript_7573/m.8339 type:complete len:92 (+) Transcript_7573:427-702(+)
MDAAQLGHCGRHPRLLLFIPGVLKADSLPEPGRLYLQCPEPDQDSRECALLLPPDGTAPNPLAGRCPPLFVRVCLHHGKNHSATWPIENDW